MLSKKIALSNQSELLDAMKDSFFQREGFGLVLVDDERSAYEAIVTEAPSLAIFDLALMDEDGIACCKKVKADGLLNETPILLILPEGGSEDLADRCWEAGCDAVVHRPLSPPRLLDAACSLLGVNRRLARRFPVSFHLQFCGPEQQRHQGTAVNLNAGGMFLKTEDLFPVDTRIILEFTLPGFGSPIECPVRVAWVNHPEWIKKNTLPVGLGVEFQSLNPTASKAIEDFLASLAVKS